MLTCHFCIAQLTSFNEWYIYKYVCNWAAQNKQISDRLEYITHLHQHTWGHMVNTQLLHCTCPKCAYKISQIFSRVFEFALAEKPRNPRKLMYRKYFRVYSKSLQFPEKFTWFIGCLFSGTHCIAFIKMLPCVASYVYAVWIYSELKCAPFILFFKNETQIHFKDADSSIWS